MVQVGEIDSSDDEFEVEGKDSTNKDNNNKDNDNQINFAANPNIVVSETAWIANWIFENPLNLWMDATKTLFLVWNICC